MSDQTLTPVPYPTTAYDTATVFAGPANPNNGAPHYFEFHHDGVLVETLQFQEGPRNTAGSTPGAFSMQVIAVLQCMLNGFQSGPYACKENEEMLYHANEMMRIATERRDERHDRGVLGYNVK